MDQRHELVKNRMRDAIGRMEGSFSSINYSIQQIKGEVGNYHDDLWPDLNEIESLLCDAQVKWNNLREKIRPGN